MKLSKLLWKIMGPSWLRFALALTPSIAIGIAAGVLLETPFGSWIMDLKHQQPLLAELFSPEGKLAEIFLEALAISLASQGGFFLLYSASGDPTGERANHFAPLFRMFSGAPWTLIAAFGAGLVACAVANACAAQWGASNGAVAALGVVYFIVGAAARVVFALSIGWPGFFRYARRVGFALVWTAGGIWVVSSVWGPLGDLCTLYDVFKQLQ